MKYKIQTKCAFGWGDLKYSEDDGVSYKIDCFIDEKSAVDHLYELLSEFGEDSGSYRVVLENVVEDFDLYS